MHFKTETHKFKTFNQFFSISNKKTNDSLFKNPYIKTDAYALAGFEIDASRNQVNRYTPSQMTTGYQRWDNLPTGSSHPSDHSVLELQ